MTDREFLAASSIKDAPYQTFKAAEERVANGVMTREEACE